MLPQANLILDKEIRALEKFAQIKGFDVVRIDPLHFVAKNLDSRDGQKYALHVQCDDYPVLPPVFTWCDPNTLELENPRNLPVGKQGYFHDSGTPCAPWNRNSYKEFRTNAPHGDWKMVGWQTNPNTGQCTNLGRMFAKLCNELKSERYQKRKIVA